MVFKPARFYISHFFIIFFFLLIFRAKFLILENSQSLTLKRVKWKIIFKIHICLYKKKNLYNLSVLKRHNIFNFIIMKILCYYVNFMIFFKYIHHSFKFHFSIILFKQAYFPINSDNGRLYLLIIILGKSSKAISPLLFCH